MELKDYLGIVPEQYTGKDIVTRSSAIFSDQGEAVKFYKVAKERLLNVLEWHSVAGLISGRFYLVNKYGENLHRFVEKGDYFKIDIPGPGSTEGGGYDWVQVEELKEMNTDQVQSIGFRVRPTHNPESDNNQTAHFYSSDATSTFIVTRKGNEVMADIIDLNLKPNDEGSTVTDRIRNVAVGAGAIGLFSKMQWKGLADGIVKQEND